MIAYLELESESGKVIDNIREATICRMSGYQYLVITFTDGKDRMIIPITRVVTFDI